MSAVTDPTWGVRPVLFHLGPLPVPSYAVFVTLGLAAGLWVYWREARRQRAASENTFYILMAGLTGGVIGAKIPILVLEWKNLAAHFPDPGPLVSGRSIVGGLVGGALAVVLVKRWLGIRDRRGNLFAPAIALGVAVGRIGCFLEGCCYGIPTRLPWGVDFGDGIPRHPTQLYESAFLLGLFLVLRRAQPRVTAPGLLFRALMIAYMSFRFLVEFIRVEPTGWLGLTLFQWIALLAVLYYGGSILRANGRQTATGGDHGTER